MFQYFYFCDFFFFGPIVWFSLSRKLKVDKTEWKQRVYEDPMSHLQAAKSILQFIVFAYNPSEYDTLSENVWHVVVHVRI